MSAPMEGRQPDKEKPNPIKTEWNSRCFLITYFQGDIGTEVDGHFSRALSNMENPSGLSQDVTPRNDPDLDPSVKPEPLDITNAQETLETQGSSVKYEFDPDLNPSVKPEPLDLTNAQGILETQGSSVKYEFDPDLQASVKPEPLDNTNEQGTLNMQGSSVKYELDPDLDPSVKPEPLAMTNAQETLETQGSSVKYEFEPDLYPSMKPEPLDVTNAQGTPKAQVSSVKYELGSDPHHFMKPEPAELTDVQETPRRQVARVKRELDSSMPPRQWVPTPQWRPPLPETPLTNAGGSSSAFVPPTMAPNRYPRPVPGSFPIQPREQWPFPSLAGPRAAQPVFHPRAFLGGHLVPQLRPEEKQLFQSHYYPESYLPYPTQELLMRQNPEEAAAAAAAAEAFYRRAGLPFYLPPGPAYCKNTPTNPGRLASGCGGEFVSMGDGKMTWFHCRPEVIEMQYSG
ncbi:PREDICTED: uncharacterized protein LOC102867629 [Elephantulus edwardii]|uniref:uncharacterized protein LOC102867629 n=1 Tax=Elephantulus edwardii TaxID=28737 RepID=UPI0003F0B56D|nr:PREDICTED: uncharacterized protein LOC102867629 [Elephantulus edwardii]